MTETANQTYPLVDTAAPQTVGAARLNTAVSMIDADIASLIAAVALKADSDSIGPAISAAIEALRDGAPGALDTLFEIAALLSEHDDAVAALLSSIAGKADSAAVSAALADKADKATTYTKAEVDDALDGVVSTAGNLAQVQSIALCF